MEDDLQVAVNAEHDVQYLSPHPAIEAPDHAVGHGRLGLGLAMLHAVSLAAGLEGIAGEAEAAVSEHVRDPEGEGSQRLRQEDESGCGGLVVLDGDVHLARAAVDGDVEVAFARDPVAILQLGQVLHIDVHEADLVLTEDAVRLAR